jgi:hypothetical protein
MGLIGTEADCRKPQAFCLELSRRAREEIVWPSCSTTAIGVSRGNHSAQDGRSLSNNQIAEISAVRQSEG